MDTETYKQRLLEEKAVLEEELKSVGQKVGPNDWEASEKGDFDGNDADPNVAADALEAYGENRAITNELEPRLEDVMYALRKIADGVYGKCEIDDGPIEEERLDADPAARTCKRHMDEEQSLPRP